LTAFSSAFGTYWTADDGFTVAAFCASVFVSACKVAFAASFAALSSILAFPL